MATRWPAKRCTGSAHILRTGMGFRIAVELPLTVWVYHSKGVRNDRRTYCDACASNLDLAFREKHLILAEAAFPR